MYTMQEQIKATVDAAQHIVVIQADNPDADSLGSALALEHILGDLGKQVSLYCGAHIPNYLHYLTGWDRVASELPNTFDLSIIVDASTVTLLEKLEKTQQLSWLKSRPCIVIDHHGTVENKITWTKIQLIDETASSSGMLIFSLARTFGWPVSPEAAGHIMMSILGDTQGLTNDLTSAETYRIMAEIIELGVDRQQLEELRREQGKMDERVYRYKAELIKDTQLTANNNIAYVVIDQKALDTYSSLYNPVPLIIPELLMIEGVRLAIVFKVYDDGKITGALRANYAYPVAGKLAELMGGGGHPYASGFKITDGKPFADVKAECLSHAASLINSQTELIA